jgi:serine protease Do
MNMVKRVMPDLIAGRKVVRGYLGIVGQDMEPEFAHQFGYKGEGGALVSEVFEGSPAAEAKMQTGDIIAEWGGKKIANWNQLRNEVAMTRPGTAVEVKVWRKDHFETLKVKAGTREEGVAGGAVENWLGVQVEDITPQYAQSLGRGDLKGVVVKSVDPDGPVAGRIGVGDVILGVNRLRVQTVADFRKALGRTKPEKGVLINFISRRTGYPQFLFVRK